MFETIVVAVDGSEHADRAAQAAAVLARGLGSKVIVVHAFDAVPTYLGLKQQQSALADGTAHGEKIAEHAAAPLREAEVDYEVDVLEGPPADAILRVAESRHADLIVIGAHGHGRLRSAVSGGVSGTVLHHAACPVLSVR